MRVRVCFHDNCFDGAASAALFTAFYRSRIDPAAEFTYRGMAHKSGEVFPPGTFDGDENACVDFRYSKDEKLTWWFDHHVSAFVSEEEAAHFRADTSGHKFFDPAARSCCNFLARTVTEKFGFDPAPFAELLHWGEIIDAAAFESPQAAVELRDPALRIMAWVEANHDRASAERLIAAFAAARPLAEIAEEPWIKEPLATIMEHHKHAIDVFRAHTTLDNGVCLYDVTSERLEAFSKFIPYYLFPESRFVVGLSQAKTRLKISVGSNPWLPRPNINIAAICERYGGGGHPVVGAVSSPRTTSSGPAKWSGIVAELRTAVPTAG